MTERSCTVAGLTNLTRYSASVVAIERDSKLTSLPSNLAYGIPAASPSTPRVSSVVVAAGGKAKITIIRSQAEFQALVTYHYVVRDATGTVVQPLVSTGLVDFVTGLTSKHTYSVVVTATTSATDNGLAPPAVSAVKTFKAK